MAGKKKKKLFKECALEMIHILKTGKFEKNAFSFCRQFISYKIDQKKNIFKPSILQTYALKTQLQVPIKIFLKANCSAGLEEGNRLFNEMG